MWHGTGIQAMDDRLLVVTVWLVVRLEDVRDRLRRESGQSMVEYAIVVALIALIAMAAVQAFGNGIAQVFQQLLSKITSLGS